MWYISSDTLFWHSIWHSIWHIWHLFWDFLWHSSDILSIWHLFWHSFRHLSWHPFWHLFWDFLWHSIWHSLSHVLRSGSAHWALELGVQVRQRPGAQRDGEEEAEEERTLIESRDPQLAAGNNPRNGYGSIPIDTFLVFFSGMNIHKSQLFWGSLGTRVLTHPQIPIKKTGKVINSHPRRRTRTCAWESRLWLRLLRSLQWSAWPMARWLWDDGSVAAKKNMARWYPQRCYQTWLAGNFPN